MRDFFTLPADTQQRSPDSLSTAANPTALKHARAHSSSHSHGITHRRYLPSMPAGSVGQVERTGIHVRSARLQRAVHGVALVGALVVGMGLLYAGRQILAQGSEGPAGSGLLCSLNSNSLAPGANPATPQSAATPWTAAGRNTAATIHSAASPQDAATPWKAATPSQAAQGAPRVKSPLNGPPAPPVSIPSVASTPPSTTAGTLAQEGRAHLTNNVSDSADRIDITARLRAPVSMASRPAKHRFTSAPVVMSDAEASPKVSGDGVDRSSGHAAKAKATNDGELIRATLVPAKTDFQLNGESSVPSPSPGALESALARADAQIQAGDVDAALSTLTTIVVASAHPATRGQHLRALSSRGMIWELRQEWERARADYQAILDDAGAPLEANLLARLGLGSVHVKNARFDDAIREFSRVIETAEAPLFPVAAALMERARAYARTDRQQLSLKDYDLVINASGLSPEMTTMAILARMSVHYEMGGHIAELKSDNELLLDVKGASPAVTAEALLRKAAWHREAGEMRQNLELTTRVIAMKKSIPTRLLAIALVNRSSGYLQDGRYQEALQDATCVLDHLAATEISERSRELATYNQTMARMRMGR